jgi:hypothetical protein
MKFDNQTMILTAGIVIVAGLLMSFLSFGTMILRYAVTGVVGWFVGAELVKRFGIDLGIRNPQAAQVASGLLGVVVVMILARIVV